jgi:4-diphosphocytidyl-2-C-methyl-D-erythritol kinase
MTTASVREFAPAKVNLTLRVGPPDARGRHPLDSVTLFARDIGDEVLAVPADDLRLVVTGPFAEELAHGADNLVLRAARALAAGGGVRAGARLVLDKRLPVASGLGGGSADAAATLRALDALWGLRAGEADLMALAASLGADVPACLASKPCRMVGTGEALVPAPAMPDLAVMLFNPKVACPTGPVFARYDARGAGPPLDRPPLADCSTLADVLALMVAHGNDLEPAACDLVAEVAVALDMISAQDDVATARMSGSGATVFALCADAAAAARVAKSTLAKAPTGWAAAGVLAGGGGA